MAEVAENARLDSRQAGRTTWLYALLLLAAAPGA